MSSDVEYKENFAIKNYYKEVKKTDVLSGDEQIRLAVKAKAGDQDSFDKLVKCNLRFVISIAKEYKASGLPLEDLISEGNIGLMEAVHRFDETKGFRFISYAVWWVRQSITKSINDNKSNVRLPINKINSINKITKVKEKLTQKLERPPSDSEILDNADVSPSDVKSYRNDGNFEFYIDSPIQNSDGLKYQDILPGTDHDDMESKMNHDALRNELKKAMSGLSTREVDIITMYYGLSDTEPMTLREIGRSLGLTNERVRQIMKDSIKRMRVFDKSVRLKDFLKMVF
jgi:RNA polymerase primary sigma factor